MNTEHVKRWTAALRTTNIEQTTGQLGLTLAGVTRMCCLGFGCTLVPEVQGLITWQDVGEDVDSVDSAMVVDLEDGEWSDSMPPKEFHVWLGATVQGGLHAGDVLPDWTNEWYDREGVTYLATLPCAKLNDNVGLTFAQIADVVDYFGVV